MHIQIENTIIRNRLETKNIISSSINKLDSIGFIIFKYELSNETPT